MPLVRITPHLRRYFPQLEREQHVDGATVAVVIANLDASFPGIAGYIVDEHGALRPHVNIFVGEEMIQDRQRLQDQVRDEQTVFIFQALSGGSVMHKEICDE